MLIFILCLKLMPSVGMAVQGNVPVVVNTWAFTNATRKAWDVVSREGRSALDAVEEGVTVCEVEQCDHTVGYGGSPDEDGETTLDAMIMDGPSHDVGAVAALRRIKNAVSVARKVLENTDHTLLVGDQATAFALKMGFKEENLSTPYSVKMWQEWKSSNCQPNFWKNVVPDPKKFCGPYRPSKSGNSSLYDSSSGSMTFGSHNHDTIGMVVIDKDKNIAAGTSSNGAKFKIPGRVGDSPIPGAGAYVDQEIGGAAATGDGDVMMRFLPSFHAVENMCRGMEPSQAAEEAMRRIATKYPSFSGAIVVVKANGDFGFQSPQVGSIKWKMFVRGCAACHGIKEFPFSVSNGIYGDTVVKTVPCIS